MAKVRPNKGFLPTLPAAMRKATFVAATLLMAACATNHQAVAPGDAEQPSSSMPAERPIDPCVGDPTGAKCLESASKIADDTSLDLDTRLDAVGSILWQTHTLLTECAAKPDKSCKHLAYLIEVTQTNWGAVLELTEKDRNSLDFIYRTV